jgi:glucose/arabinose dehydrogenase/mono/diheme cytochrome c family protein
MKKGIPVIAVAVFIQVIVNSACNSGTTDSDSIATDAATIAAGESSFTKNCSGCHNFRQDGIGPELSGLTTTVSPEWIRHFIKDPQQVISSGDEHASQLMKKYKAVMPSFPALTDYEIDAIIAFMHTHKSSGKQAVAKGNEILDPIPDTIENSNLAVNLKFVAQIPASSDSARLPLTRITKLSFQPGSDDLFIVDLRGKLYRLHNNIPAVYMDMARLKPKFIPQPGLATGFGSFAFHPDFKRNGLLYTTHTEPPRSAKPDFSYPDSIKVMLQWVLTEWKTQDPAATTFSGTGRELLRVNMVDGIHGVQEIAFNSSSKPGDHDYGMLYIGVGDGGSVEHGYEFLAHSTKKIWGTILRINPMGRNSANGQYGIPPDNPFVKDQNSETVKEIYAYGFRNPHRISWTTSGKMLACNVGQANIESVDLIMPGHDYGWPLREGTFVSSDLQGNLGKVYPLPANDSIYKITYPVAQYDHDEGIAISGGFEYQQTVIPGLKGKFLFGDIASGRLFYITVADIKQGKQASIKEWNISMNGVSKTLLELCGGKRADLHFGKDSRGDLYILTKTDGKVYKLVNATKKS